MNTLKLRSRRGVQQRGAVIIIALIILVIISLVVASAFTLSTTNLKSVGNVQYRSEAVTAANSAIESIITGTFLTALNTTTNVDVDINKDGTNDYAVSVAIPTCPVRIARVSLDTPSGYETTGGVASSAGSYISDWELVATVSDAATGAQAVVREGVRVPIGESDYQTKVAAGCGLTLITT
jgi:Tfp pilus assembly protein PilX